MMQLYAVKEGTLVSLPRTRLPKEEMLENWIVEDPRILGLNVMVIGQQVPTAHGARIDILAIDSEGSVPRRSMTSHLSTFRGSARFLSRPHSTLRSASTSRKT